jgi:hypothetical protein
MGLWESTIPTGGENRNFPDVHNFVAVYNENDFCQYSFFVGMAERANWRRLADDNAGGILSLVFLILTDLLLWSSVSAWRCSRLVGWIVNWSLRFGATAGIKSTRHA